MTSNFQSLMDAVPVSVNTQNTVVETAADATVFVVDDDPQFRESLRLLLSSVPHRVQLFGDAHEFLEKFRPEQLGCLVLDVRLPGISGLDLQKILLDRQYDIPVIIVTGYAEVPMAVRAVKSGAMDFIEKPFTPQLLLNKVDEAIAKAIEVRKTRASRADVAHRLGTLSARERAVLDMLVEAKTTKQIANSLGISPKTVDKHRWSMLQKMDCDSPLEVVQLLRTATG